MTAILITSVFILLLLHLLRVSSWMKDKTFDVWLRILTMYYNNRGSDNRSFKSFDSLLYGCDLFEGYKPHFSTYVTAELSKKENKIPEILQDEVVLKMLENGQYAKAVLYSKLCGKNVSDIEFLERLESGEANFRIRDSFWRMKFSSYCLENGVYFDVETESGEVLYSCFKLMNLWEIHSAFQLFNCLSVVGLPVVQSHGLSYYKNGVELGSLLDNITKIKLVYHENSKEFKIHNKGKEIRNEQSLPLVSTPVKPDLETEDVGACNDYSSRLVQKSSSFKRIEKVDRLPWRASHYNYDHICTTSFAILIILFIIGLETKLTFILMLTNTVVSFMPRFRFKFLVFTVLPKRIRLPFFKKCFQYLGDNTCFCGLNNYIPTLVINQLYLNSCPPLERGFNMEEVELMECPKEYQFSYSKASVSFESVGVSCCITVVKNNFLKSQITYSLNLNRIEQSCLYTILKRIQEGSAGLGGDEQSVLGFKFIHLFEVNEIINLVQRSDCRLFEVNYINKEVYTGTQCVNITQESIDVCKSNGWSNFKTIAILKLFCESFWGEGNVGSNFYEFLPGKSQSLNRSWFPKMPNKRMKIFLSSVSEIVYKTAGIKYFKIDIMKRCPELISALELMKQGVKVIIVQGGGNTEPEETGFCTIIATIEEKTALVEGGNTSIDQRIKEKIYKGLTCFFDTHIEKSSKAYNKAGVLKKGVPNGLEGYMLRNSLVAVGNSKARKAQTTAWFNQWKSEVGEERVKQELKDPTLGAYSGLTKGRATAMVSNIITMDGTVKDLRLSKGKPIVILKSEKLSAILGPNKAEPVKKMVLSLKLRLGAENYVGLPNERVFSVDSDLAYYRHKGKKEKKENKGSGARREMRDKPWGATTRGSKRKHKRVNKDGHFSKKVVPIKYVWRKIAQWFVDKLGKNELIIDDKAPNLPFLTRNKLKNMFVKSVYCKKVTLKLNKWVSNYYEDYIRANGRKACTEPCSSSKEDDTNTDDGYSDIKLSEALERASRLQMEWDD